MTQLSCAVPDCERPHAGHGYCDTHLKRVTRTGSTEVVPRVRRTCTFSECGRPAVSDGLCKSHDNQVKRGKPLTPLRSFHKTTIRDALGRKRCNTCEDWLAVSEFYPSPRNKDGLQTYCKRCDRSLRLQRNYGITIGQYEAMLAAQGGGCAICGGQPRDRESFAVDHDHACCPQRMRSCGECVRGLLCEDCNRGIGMFEDSVPRIEAAIAYLTR